MSLFPEDDKQRKSIPVFKMITGYFPKALREITKVCVANNVRYNPDREPSDINWARGKSPDQLGSALHHMMESAVDGKVFEDVPPEVAAKVGFDKVYVLAEAAWRVNAALELAIEKQEAGDEKGSPMIGPYHLVDETRKARKGYVYCTADKCPSHKLQTGVCGSPA